MATIQEALLAAVDHHQAGRLREAEILYARIIGADPEQADAWHLYGVLAAQAGSLDAAERLIRRAVALVPDAPDHYGNLAKARRAAGRPATAERPYRAALRLRPDNGDALAFLTDLWHGDRRWDAALPALRSMAALDPGAPDAHLRLGVALNGLGRPAESEAALARAARLDPAGPATYNLARLDTDRKEHARALARLRIAVAASPAHADAVHNLASVLLTLGLVPAASAWFARAAALEPARADAAWNVIVAGLYRPQPDAAARFAAYRTFAARFARPLHAAAPVHTNSPDPDRRLRVGYLSTDLRAFQPVTRNLLPVFAARDRDRFELFCYADVARPDATTARFRALCDGWRDVAGLDDRTVADMVRADGIDVLVVLAGHFDRNRPMVCAHRPAPVQVSHHDVATSGLEVMDALIADRVLVPPGTPERFTERPVRLPSYVIMAPPPESPEVGPPPMLRRGFATFGCFNNPAKVSDATLMLWARVLGAVPGARLRLKYQNLYGVPACLDRVLSVLGRAGVDPARVEVPVDGELGLRDHLALYRDVDVALDPFPFSGSTTTFEALWMGVPVVTWAQERMVSRWSASMLAALGLGRFVAATADEYVAIAARAAGAPDGLADLRAGLRPAVLASPLCDGPRMARNLERAYRALWRRWCAHQSRQSVR
ncbi:MAG TPA: tetratricopeptide repeat protein [Azospirillum sp.]|nr:tetratricopeptide repeat protein [Azospirillum sp.]